MSPWISSIHVRHRASPGLRARIARRDGPPTAPTAAPSDAVADRRPPTADRDRRPSTLPGPAFDRPRRIRRTTRSTTREDPRAAEAGVFQRQQVVAGGHARSAIHHHLAGGVSPSSACHCARSSSGALERLVVGEIALEEVVPGAGDMTRPSCPASRPRRESAPSARASTSTRDGSPRPASTASTSSRHVLARRADETWPARHCSRPPRTGWPSRIQRAKPPSSTATASCPMKRSIHHRRAAYMPLSAS